MDAETILERRRLRRRASFWRVTAFLILAVAIVVGAGLATDFEGLEAAPAAARSPTSRSTASS